MNVEVSTLGRPEPLEEVFSVGGLTLNNLRREVRRRGWYRPPTARLLVELASHLALLLAGIAAFVATGNLVVRAGALIILTAGSVGILTNTHSSSHNATAARKWGNELLTYFGYTFFGGMSAHYWLHKHVVVHHPSPNVVGVDLDSDLSPWFALSEREVLASHGWRRAYYERMQQWIFPLAIATMVFSMQVAGWRHLWREICDPDRRSRKHGLDVAALLLHGTVWLALPMFFFAPAAVAGFYVLHCALMGYGIFAVSSPGHMPVYALCIDGDEPSNDFLLRQAATSANFTTGRVGRWLCSGLEYQIEHHLFPRLSHVYYPQLSPLVQEVCRRAGVPYNSRPWGRALWQTLAALAAPKRIEPSLEAVRLAPQEMAAARPSGAGEERHAGARNGA